MSLLVVEDFEPLVDSDFIMPLDDGTEVVLKLTEVMPSRFPGAPNGRKPFSLSFLSQDPRVFDQNMYRLNNERLGQFELFLVPAAKDDSGVSYHSTFA
jgi:hypothetical protein